MMNVSIPNHLILQIQFLEDWSLKRSTGKKNLRITALIKFFYNYRVSLFDSYLPFLSYIALIIYLTLIKQHVYLFYNSRVFITLIIFG